MQERKGEEDACTGRQWKHVDRGEDEQQAAPGAGVELRRELGEGQPVRTIFGDDLREALREGQRTIGGGLSSRSMPLLRQADGGLGLARTGAPSSVARAAPSARMRSSSAGSRRSSSRRARIGASSADQRVGQRRLERAEALAGEAREHLLDALAGDRARRCRPGSCASGRPSSACRIVGQRLGVGLRLADLLRDRVVAVGQVDPAHVRRIGLGHFRRAVAQAHDPRRRSAADERLGRDEQLDVEVGVELDARCRGRARHAASGPRRPARGSPGRAGCRRPGAPDKSNRPTDAPSRFLPALSFHWVMRLSQPIRAVPLRIQASSAWAGTALWRNRIDLFGIDAAGDQRRRHLANVRAAARRDRCRPSARGDRRGRYRHSASSCIRTQRRIAPSKLPRWRSPVGWMPETTRIAGSAVIASRAPPLEQELSHRRARRRRSRKQTSAIDSIAAADERDQRRPARCRIEPANQGSSSRRDGEDSAAPISSGRDQRGAASRRRSQRVGLEMAARASDVRRASRQLTPSDADGDRRPARPEPNARAAGSGRG